MDRTRIMLSVIRINLPLSLLFASALLVDLIFGDITIRNILPLAVPLAISALLYLSSFLLRRRSAQERTFDLFEGMLSFLYMAIIGSFPFLLSGTFGLAGSLFESFAGFTTTGLSGHGPEVFMGAGAGMLFYRVAIQWFGGLFYLVTAFRVLSEISDMAKRSAERRIFVRMGLVPTLSNLLYNLTVVYSLFTIVLMLFLRITGQSVYDSICISMSIVSTGGYSSTGIVLNAGPGLHLLIMAFMIWSGMGYHVHLSLLSARNRRRTLLDPENLIYLSMVVASPLVIGAILLLSGMPLGESIWKGAFASISSMTTTGTSLEGIASFPDPAKMALLLLMLIGGSSLSVASGFKVQRLLFLGSALKGEVKKTAHPGLVLTLKRGEGTYSGRSLESAGSAFAIMVLTIAITALIILAFEGGDIFSVMSLIVTTISNTGLCFGTYSTVEGISALNPLLKIALSVVMFIGRFELLLPLHLLAYRAYSFSYRSRSILRRRG
ncbi:MAG: potassium transporter TrkG [Candidatus Thermoplasmatota archaeon]|nr:potassium transporter TrkG [Candidatus Thermoplasmatota archaeon]